MPDNKTREIEFVRLNGPNDPNETGWRVMNIMVAYKLAPDKPELSDAAFQLLQQIIRMAENQIGLVVGYLAHTGEIDKDNNPLLAQGGPVHPNSVPVLEKLIADMRAEDPLTALMRKLGLDPDEAPEPANDDEDQQDSAEPQGLRINP